MPDNNAAEEAPVGVPADKIDTAVAGADAVEPDDAEAAPGQESDTLAESASEGESVSEVDLSTVVPAEELLASVELARAALLDITSEQSIGEPVGWKNETVDAVALLFASSLPGYPDWTWSVTVARATESDTPTVLELGLVPGEGSLLAPEWVPWSVRLADYKAHQLAEAEDHSDDDEDEDGLDDDRFDDESEDPDDTDIDFDDADDDVADDDGDIDGVDLESADREVDDAGDLTSLGLSAGEAFELPTDHDVHGTDIDSVIAEIIEPEAVDADDIDADGLDLDPGALPDSSKG